MSRTDPPSLEIPGHVLVREVDGEMVLLNLESEQYYGLDPVGASIVTKVTSMPTRDAVAALSEDFEVDVAVLERDIEDLVEQLLSVGLLVRVADAG